MLRISITIEGPALEMAARLRAVAAALEDEPRIRNHITDDSPAPTINRNIVTDNGPSMPEGLNRNHIADDHPAQVEPSPAPPRQNGPTAAQRAALEAYRASLPPRPVKPEPQPRPFVEHQTHAPATADRKPARELWEEVKDDAERLRWFEAYGKEHGFPALMIRWSGGMTTQARAAWDRKPAAAPC